MRYTMIPQLMRQLFKKPFTNKHPRKYIPSSSTNFFKDVKEGNAKVNPPVATPEKFRGKIVYDREKCTGCKLCLMVCPSEAIMFKDVEKKIRIYVARCTFCAQCNDVCPVNCLSMSSEFLLADTKKYSPNLIVE